MLGVRFLYSPLAMDSLTQIVLGASITAASVPAGQRRTALLLGATLGTLPDLDVFIDFGGAVENYTYHRGFSHSLFVLVPFAILLWLVLKRFWAPVRDASRPWFWAILLTLVTHPLLDSHNAYGTQLFWPVESPPVSWSTLFIIDPLFTLPLLIGTLFAAIRPASRHSGTLLATGLALSSLYLGWTWVGKGLAENAALESLAAAGLPTQPVFSTPTPFNSLLWRVVVVTEQGHVEGLYSLVADEAPMHFVAHDSNRRALEAASGIWAVDRLVWFSNGFMKPVIEGDTLVLADLRMGQAPVFVFRHEVARYDGANWLPIETRLQPAKLEKGFLGAIWQRIWTQPGKPATN